MFLVNSRLNRFSAAPSRFRSKSLHASGAPLLPKLRGEIAEFLNVGSLARLRILSSPTCVGLRYGHYKTHGASFSWPFRFYRFGLSPRHLPSACAYTSNPPSNRGSANHPTHCFLIL